jgi:hypothetical protein
MIYIENKLSGATPLTSPQNGDLKSSSYKIRSKNEASQFASGKNLVQRVDLRFFE